MSLYEVQKFLYQVNRDPALQERYLADRGGVLTPYDLTHEEVRALVQPDIGLLFHLGVNGQILMHFAALHQIPWADYLRLMREGIERTARPRPRGRLRGDRLRGRARARDGGGLMPLVFAGVCSHAPGITTPADQANAAVRNAFYDAFGTMRASLEAARPEAVVVVAAEHFANFFMDNMPSLALGMADRYDGPIEDPAWLGIDRVQLPGDRDLSQRFITEVMQGSNITYAEEWRFDHGIMVPLHFLTRCTTCR